ncbi:N-acetyltransferase [Diaminobutyricibacter tongyongensis]|uniref:N-acetyltransferase n=1 Tax=Leifsonia tongyongensis TaxID=1268043 RepID=A0A6L9Y363_9MICO|nr:GNAT family N-acetyltransferase [Diaminobutyricibacter tongyongensis]NEN07847.1 N-acetyltransferase [Diaminobutyricibacter tongyongensis]
MTNASDSSSGGFEYRGGSGNPDGVGSLTRHQAVLIDEVIADGHAPTLSFFVRNDDKTRIYEAIAGDTVIAGLTYNFASDNRLVLVATAVFPAYRKQGIASELIRRVLNEVRTQGKTVSIMCPIVWAFIERNPEYADLVDPKHPGMPRGAHRS